MVLRGSGTGLATLPPALRLGVLAIALLVGMVGCSAAWIDQQSYTPSPNICRQDEIARTDCIHQAQRQVVIAPEVAR